MEIIWDLLVAPFLFIGAILVGIWESVTTTPLGYWAIIAPVAAVIVFVALERKFAKTRRKRR